MELAIFVDAKLWAKFSRREGAYADKRLKNYVITVLNNVQCLSMLPPLTNVLWILRFK